jgi:hypothetical protein
LGVDKDLATVSDEVLGEFFQSCTLTMKLDDFVWKLFNVHGPAHDDRKQVHRGNLNLGTELRLTYFSWW